MGTQQDKYKDWRRMDATQRVLTICEDANLCWLAVEQQYARISRWGDEPQPIIQRTTYEEIDADVFLLVLRRLLVLAGITQETADPRKVMPAAMARFAADAGGYVMELATLAEITALRTSLEDFTKLRRRASELAFARGEYGWYVAYRGKMYYTSALVKAAYQLYRAIRSAVDTEASAGQSGQVCSVSE